MLRSLLKYIGIAVVCSFILIRLIVWAADSVVEGLGLEKKDYEMIQEELINE